MNAWIDNRLHYMAKEAGLDFTTFFTRCLSEFFDLPPDPRQEMIRIKSHEVVLRLRVQYQNEMRELTKAETSKDAEIEIKKLQENKRIKELQVFGSLLERTTCYDRVIEACQDLDAENPVWQAAIDQVNRMNGSKYDFDAFWNNSLEWHRRIFKAQKA